MTVKTPSVAARTPSVASARHAVVARGVVPDGEHAQQRGGEEAERDEAEGHEANAARIENARAVARPARSPAGAAARRATGQMRQSMNSWAGSLGWPAWIPARIPDPR